MGAPILRATLEQAVTRYGTQKRVAEEYGIDPSTLGLFLRKPKADMMMSKVNGAYNAGYIPVVLTTKDGFIVGHNIPGFLEGEPIDNYHGRVIRKYCSKARMSLLELARRAEIGRRGPQRLVQTGTGGAGVLEACASVVGLVPHYFIAPNSISSRGKYHFIGSGFRQRIRELEREHEENSAVVARYIRMHPSTLHKAVAKDNCRISVINAAYDNGLIPIALVGPDGIIKDLGEPNFLLGEPTENYIGRAIAEIIKEQGLRQYEVAAQSGIEKSQLHRIIHKEKGRVKDIEAIARVLGYDLFYFVEQGSEILDKSKNDLGMKLLEQALERCQALQSDLEKAYGVNGQTHPWGNTMERMEARLTMLADRARRKVLKS